ncbi:MAG: TfoX/Sxy family protein [Deltaproteobacteria bacterium]|jgi:TfoX/Sxy family transcriptional regulator of competence genes|nr:TfoX/Sxy family protein [Deltaproteobacteria bacterium]
MSISDEFISFVSGILDGAGAVRSRKMFGGCIIYLNGKPVFLVDDDTVFVKVHPCLDGLLADAEKASPYPGAKEHYILDIDDAGLAREVALALEPHLEVPKPRKGKGAHPEVAKSAKGGQATKGGQASGSAKSTKGGMASKAAKAGKGAEMTPERGMAPGDGKRR